MKKTAIKNLSDHKILLIFSLLWFILNIFQSVYTELANDEAYYWLWSKHLDWGFYEHPPLVAIFIKIGGLFSSTELGVRLVTTIASTLALYLVYVKLIKKDVWLYLALITSIFIIHVGSFLTAPDSPLLLFTVLFFIAFKHYLNDDSKKNGFLITLVITAMMYSKYHGALIIVISFLSNIQLLKRKSFWLITFFSLLLYSPHLYWLFNDGQAGLTYALSDRFQDSLEINNVINFIAGQLVVFGPLMSVIIFYTSLKYKSTSPFEKTLKRLIVIMLLYFLVWSLKGAVEANWTATLFVPLILLSHRYIQERQKLRKIVFFLWVPSLLILLLIRVHLMFDILPFTRDQNRGNEFFGWKEYAERVDSLAQGKPVLVSRYQNASKLWFYRNEKTLSLNTGKRINQFYEWSDYQKELLDSTVLIIDGWLLDQHGEIDERGVMTPYQWVNGYRNYREVVLTLEEDFPVELKPGEKLAVKILVTPPSEWCISGRLDTESPPHLAYGVTNIESNEMPAWKSGITYFENALCHDSMMVINFEAPLVRGNYEVDFNIVTENTLFWHSNCRFLFKVN